MARKQGWQLRRSKGRYYVRWSHEGARYEYSTGTGDPRVAAERAARIYADHISGAAKPRARLTVSASTPLDEVGALWLAAIRREVDSLTYDLWHLYIATHWQPYFETLSALTESAIASYARARLDVVLARTVRKELSAQRGTAAPGIRGRPPGPGGRRVGWGPLARPLARPRRLAIANPA